MESFDRFLPDSFFDHPRKLRLGRLVVGTCASLVVLLGLTLGLRLTIGPLAPSALAMALLSIGAFAGIPWLLYRTESLWWSSRLTVVVFLVLMIGQAIRAGGPGAPVAVLLPLIPLLATHLVGPRAGRRTMLVVLLFIAAWIVLEQAGVELPSRDLNAVQDSLSHGLLLTLAVLLVALLTSGYEQQRKILERRLRQADALYRKLFDQSKDMVALTTPEGKVVDVNQAGVELYGFSSREEFLQADLKSLYVHPEQREELIRRLERDGFVRDFESLQQKVDGQRLFIEGTTTAVRDDQGRISHFLAILRDVTLRHRAAEERERMVAELGRQNRELERFTYAVSHDLKSPLITLRGFLEMWSEDVVEDSPDRSEDLSLMLRTTERMQAMVDGLLELAQVGASKESWAPQSLAELAHDVEELIAGRIQENGITVEIHDDLPTVHGDRVLLTELLQNLMDNAAKFLAGRPDPKIEVGRRDDPEREVIFVRDNGPGLDPADTERVFGLFSKIDQEGAGTGIGLAIVKKVVDLHGGEVWVESEGLDRGASFCFTLPKAV